MPRTEDHDPRKAAVQRPVRREFSEEKSADETDAVKEPVQETVEHHAGKIIGNG